MHFVGREVGVFVGDLGFETEAAKPLETKIVNTNTNNNRFRVFASFEKDK
jgi:hypothetical protein